MCKGGDTMRKSGQKLEFTVGEGAINEMLDVLGDVVRMTTCGTAENALSTHYQQDDRECYCNQLLYGVVCGCPDDSEIRTLGWTQHCSGILSLLGSLLIILSIIMNARKVRWLPYNQIVLGISFFDSLSSIAYIIGTAFTQVEFALPGSIGNQQATCGFHPWLFQISITSVYYSILLWVYFLLVVKYNWTERKFNKVLKWVHLGVVSAGLIMAFVVILHCPGFDLYYFNDRAYGDFCKACAAGVSQNLIQKHERERETPKEILGESNGFAIWLCGSLLSSMLCGRFNL